MQRLSQVHCGVDYEDEGGVGVTARLLFKTSQVMEAFLSHLQIGWHNLFQVSTFRT